MHADPEENYDCIIVGTGIKESVLAGLLSSKNHRILQIDTESTYGSSSKTLGYKEFLGAIEKVPESFISQSESKIPPEFQIDLTPKIFLADEGLIQIIAENNLSYCIDFSVISEQYLITPKSTLLIPTTKTAALKSRICGPLQLIKLHRFIGLIKSFYEAEETDRVNISSKYSTVESLYNTYGISENIQEILGHGIALFTSNAYLKDNPYEFIMRLTTYFRSVARVNKPSGKGNSPFLYPKYGISEVSQGFARLSAVKGGTTRMQTHISSVELLHNNQGYSLTLLSDSDLPLSNPAKITASYIISSGKESLYFGGSMVEEKKILRGVLILKNPAKPNPNPPPTRQALISSSASSMANDLFLLVVGSDECVCPEGYSIGYITAETASTPVPAPSHLNLPSTFSGATEQIEKWNYKILQMVYWIDSAPVYVSNNSLFTPLLPMDSTVDFRTILKEVESVVELLGESLAHSSSLH